MGSTVQFNIRGNKPPFVVDLRESTVDGTIIQTVNLEVSGTTQFTNIEAGNYYIVANDISGTIATYALNIDAPPTTTTTTTTTLSPNAEYIIGGGGELIKLNVSTNNGSSWIDVTPIYTPTNRIHAISVINNVAYVHGNGRILYKSIDGGFTWTNISSAIASIPSLNNNTMYAIDENIVLIGTPVGDTVFYRSTNGGTSFSSISKGITMAMSKFEFSDANIGYAINIFPTIGGSSVVAKTTNGGLTWTNITAPIMPTSKSYIDVSFYGSIGYIVTGSDVIFKTVDGGSNWTSITQPLDTFVSGVKALSATDVIVIGTNGAGTINKLSKSTNGGSTWTTTNITATGNGQIITASYYGKNFDMINATNGVIPLLDPSGGTTKTLVTNDGGNTWTFGGNTTLVFPNHYWAIGARRNSFVTTTTTTAAPTPKLFWSVSGAGGSLGRLKIKKNGSTIVDQSTSSPFNSNFPIANGDFIEIFGSWQSGSGNEVKFRVCSANNGEIAYYDKIGIVPDPGWDDEKTHSITYTYSVLGDLTVSLRTNGVNPPGCIIYS